MALILASASLAFADPPALPQRTQTFDIPSQPLSSALRELGTKTSLNLLYENNIAARQRSPPVVGSMTREAALAAMLDGTGLLYRFTGADAAVIFPPDRLPDDVATAGRPAGAGHMMLGLLPVSAKPLLGSRNDADFVPFSQAVQSAIDRRLETNPLVHGRMFVAILRVEVGTNGALHLASLAKSTGDAALDHSIAMAVNGAVAPSAPPAGMPQPIWFELTNQR